VNCCPGYLLIVKEQKTMTTHGACGGSGTKVLVWLQAWGHLHRDLGHKTGTAGASLELLMLFTTSISSQVDILFLPVDAILALMIAAGSRPWQLNVQQAWCSLSVDKRPNRPLEIAFWLIGMFKIVKFDTVLSPPGKPVQALLLWQVHPKHYNLLEGVKAGLLTPSHWHSSKTSLSNVN